MLKYLRNQATSYGDAERWELDLMLIDYNQPGRNVYEVTEEFSVHDGRYGNREDVVFLINGIPVLVIECKNANCTSESENMMPLTATPIIRHGCMMLAGSCHFLWKHTPGASQAPAGKVEWRPEVNEAEEDCLGGRGHFERKENGRKEYRGEDMMLKMHFVLILSLSPIFLSSRFCR